MKSLMKRISSVFFKYQKEEVMKKIVLIISLITAHSVFGSLDILHTPGMKIGLGGNVNINFPFEKKERCLKPQKGLWTQVDQGALKLSWSSQSVSSHRDLDEKLNRNITLLAKAKFKLISFDGKYENSLTKNFKSTKDTLNYLVHAFYDYGQKEIEDVQLKERYQKLLDEGRFNEFIHRCGTHFVQSTHQQAAVSMLIKTESLNSTEMRKIVNSLSIGGSYGGISGSVTGKIDDYFNLVQKYGRTQISVESFGGEAASFNGFSSLEPALESFTSFLKGMRKETSAPTRYTLIPFSGLPEVDMTEIHEEFLKKAYYLSIEIDDELERAERLIRTYKGNQSKWLRHLYSVQEVLLKRQKLVSRLVKGCEISEKCSLDDLDLPKLNTFLTTDFVRKIDISKKESDGIVQIILEGQFLSRELISKVEVLRVNTNFEEVTLPVKLEDFAINFRDSRFIGVIDTYFNEADKVLEYRISVEDVNGFIENYILEI